MIYIAVLCNSRITTEPLYNTPLVHWTLCRCQQYGAFSMKARYQIILLGEQRHIRCEQLAQGCCPNNAAVGVEPATSWSRVQCPTTTLLSHLNICKSRHATWTEPWLLNAEGRCVVTEDRMCSTLERRQSDDLVSTHHAEKVKPAYIQVCKEKGPLLASNHCNAAWLM